MILVAPNEIGVITPITHSLLLVPPGEGLGVRFFCTTTANQYMTIASQFMTIANR